MDLGELGKEELIALAKKEGERLIKAIEIQNIAMGNEAIKGMKVILDVAVSRLDFAPMWHTGPIDYLGKTFCLTGDFATGTKAECAKKIQEKGGIIAKTVTLSVDYLIVGGERIREWAHENYGRKIERALELRHKRKSNIPYIVAESDWIKTL